MQDASISTGIDLPGMNPLAFDFLDITGQVFFKKKGKRIGGAVRVFGIVIMSMGAKLIKPCSGSNPDLESYSWYQSQHSWYPQYYGYCGFKNDEFAGVTAEHNKVKPIMPKKVHGRSFHVAGIKISIVAMFVLNFNGGLTTAMEDHYWRLLNWWWRPQCAAESYAANLGTGAYLRIDLGGSATAGPLRAFLGLELKLFEATARGTGELLQTGFGKEISIQLSALAGQIVTRCVPACDSQDISC